jgi:hypothetical protein
MWIVYSVEGPMLKGREVENKENKSVHSKQDHWTKDDDGFSSLRFAR